MCGSTRIESLQCLKPCEGCPCHPTSSGYSNFRAHQTQYTPLTPPPCAQFRVEATQIEGGIFAFAFLPGFADTIAFLSQRSNVVSHHTRRWQSASLLISRLCVCQVYVCTIPRPALPGDSHRGFLSGSRIFRLSRVPGRATVLAACQLGEASLCTALPTHATPHATP